MAGVAGFEPTNAGVKVPCLTAWRHPNIAFTRLPVTTNSGVSGGIRTHDLQSHNLAF